ncbi:hypothetical protein ACFSX5_02280 [Devosia albogilva]|uniref:Uncharacterized protein n=1 Tax=Devosia albogilva TaxID=429726 RepID=A0ABW5QGD5_9HYPH
MTFKYSATIPISGGNKLHRFREWAGESLPDLEYNLPVQTPIKTETMTIRLKSLEDRQKLLQKLSEASL